MSNKEYYQEYGMPLSAEKCKQLYDNCDDGQAKRRARRAHLRELKKKRKK